MRVKIVIPCILQDGNVANISFEADLSGPILGTTDGKTTVVQVDTPIIEILDK